MTKISTKNKCYTIFFTNKSYAICGKGAISEKTAQKWFSCLQVYVKKMLLVEVTQMKNILVNLLDSRGLSYGIGKY